jgi:hypothetical protein
MLLYRALAYSWLLVAASVWFVNHRMPNPLRFWILFPIAWVASYAALYFTAVIFNHYLLAEWMAFDLNGDGIFRGPELSIEQQIASDRYVADHVSIHDFIEAIPFTAIWTALTFSVHQVVVSLKKRYQKVASKDQEVVLTNSSAAVLSPENPYESPAS